MLMQKRREIPKRPDKQNAIRKAREFLFVTGICWLPVDPEAIFAHYGWYLLTWKEARQVLKTPDPLFLKKTGAEARTSIPRGTGDILTVYDASITPPTRIRWTLAHEIGHIVLGHLQYYQETGINRGGLTPAKCKVLEDEADFFAAELLEPMRLVKVLGCRNYREVMQIFQVSRQAAANRLTDLEWRGKTRIATEADHDMDRRFRRFLQPVAICSSFKGSLPVKPAPILAEVFTMSSKVAFVNVDEKGRFTRCPRCGNEDFSANANFCKICGLYLYNTCPHQPFYDHNETDNYGNIIDVIPLDNPGDARFCEHCGDPTLLTKLGLLMSWEEVIEEYGAINAGLSVDAVARPEQVAEAPALDEWANLAPGDDEVPF